jgi:hypothetical protein
LDLVTDLVTDLAITDSATGSVTQDLALDFTALDITDSDAMDSAMDLEMCNFAQKIYFFFSLFNVNFM